jgi:hypothetical protein
MVPLAYAILALFYVAAGGGTGWPFAIVHGLAIIVSIAVVVRSVLHIRRNESLTSDGKLAWALLALFLGVVTLPVYWNVVVHRDDAATAS